MPEQPPEEVRLAVEQCLQYAREGSQLLKERLCFTDAKDQEWFSGAMPKNQEWFSGAMPKDETIWAEAGRKVFVWGHPVAFQRVADDCWLVLLDTHYALDLWLVNGKWQVLCPISGRQCIWKGKIEQEKHRWLNTEEMKQVQEETDTQLERRRNRYLAVLALKQKDQIRNLWVYYSGIPTEDAAALRKMTLADFRKAVILKLDAPDGLRYRLEVQGKTFTEEQGVRATWGKTFVEGQPVRVTFSLENVTTKPIMLTYGPLVYLVDFSNAISSAGAAVLAKNCNRRFDDPYTLWHPFDKQELVIPPGQTTTMDVTLTDYYDLHAAQYLISAYLEESGGGSDDYWRGVARTDMVRFAVRARP